MNIHFEIMRSLFSIWMSSHASKGKQYKTSEKIRVYTSWEIGPTSSELGLQTCRICYDVMVLWSMAIRVVMSVLHDALIIFLFL